MKKEITEIVLMNSGDYSVGIKGFELSLKVNGDYNFHNDEERENFEAFLKEQLKLYFEGENGFNEVFTRKEWNSLIDAETAYLESLNEGE